VVSVCIHVLPSRGIALESLSDYTRYMYRPVQATYPRGFWQVARYSGRSAREWIRVQEREEERVTYAATGEDRYKGRTSPKC